MLAMNDKPGGRSHRGVGIARQPAPKRTLQGSGGCGSATMLNTLLPILLFAALGLAVLGALRRVAMWRRGRASKVDLIGGLFAMPKRYMVDLHHVVARDKYIANTHVATAGGAVASVVLAIMVHGFGLHNRFLGYALLLMTAVMFVGATHLRACRKARGCACRKACWRSRRRSSW